MNTIALAERHALTSCSEASLTAASRPRVVIPAAAVVGVHGTSAPINATTALSLVGYVMPITDARTKFAPSGHPTWSPPV